jgi:hypothetical protein
VVTKVSILEPANCSRTHGFEEGRGAVTQLNVHTEVVKKFDTHMNNWCWSKDGRCLEAFLICGSWWSGSRTTVNGGPGSDHWVDFCWKLVGGDGGEMVDVAINFYRLESTEGLI